MTGALVFGGVVSHFAPSLQRRCAHQLHFESVSSLSLPTIFLSAVGRLGVTDISLTDTVYDPEVHYFEVRRKWWGISITYGDGRRRSIDLWDSHGQHRPMK